MEDDVEALALSAIVVATIYKRDKKQKAKRKVWTKPWLQRRESKGMYKNLVEELRLEEELLYSNYLRMTKESFNVLLCLIRSEISKETTNMREPIPPELKLVVTIR